MPTPRVTIDELPAHTTPVDGNHIIVQDAGVTRKMSIATLKTLESAAVTAHLADTADAHDASAISAADSGYGIDGGNVQTQLEQLAGAITSKDVVWVGTDAPGDQTIEMWWDTDEPDIPGGGGALELPPGGATGEVLAKNSATDYDVEWVPQTGGGGGLPPDAVYGDVTVSGSGATWNLNAGVVGTPEIADGAVSNAKQGNINQNLIKGRVTASTGVVENLTPAQVRTVIASDSGGGTANFLRADATWAAPPGGGGGIAGITVSEAGAALDADITTLDFLAGFDLTETPENEVNIALDLSEYTGAALPVASGGTGATSAGAALTALGAQPVDTDLTTIAGLTATTDNIIQSVGSAWASRTPAQVKTALALDQVTNTSDANKPVSTATQTALNLKANLSYTIVTKSGTSETTLLTDAGCYLRFSGTNPSFTIPPESTVNFPIGTEMSGIGLASAMTIVNGAGVTIRKARTYVTVGVYSGWTIIKTLADTWDLHGDFV